MEDFPKPVTKQITEIILDQMNTNFIYKINQIKGKFSLGFFFHINRRNKKIPFLATNTYKVDEDNKGIINVSINNELKQIQLGKTKYRNEKFNISLIQIKEVKNINIHYLELDEKIYNQDSELFYYKESVYIIHPNKLNDISVSYGILNGISKSQ